jgi:hypothetical protein
MARKPKFHVDLNFWTFIYVSVVLINSMYSQCICAQVIFGFLAVQLPRARYFSDYK